MSLISKSVLPTVAVTVSIKHFHEPNLFYTILVNNGINYGDINWQALFIKGLYFFFQSNEVEETLKRLQSHKGVVGTIVVNAEGVLR